MEVVDIDVRLRVMTCRLIEKMEQQPKYSSSFAQTDVHLKHMSHQHREHNKKTAQRAERND